SDTTTATSTPTRARTASRTCRAERSASTGRSAARPASTFETSTPAFAHTNPWRGSLVTRAPRRRGARTRPGSLSARPPPPAEPPDRLGPDGRPPRRAVVAVERHQAVLGLRDDLLGDDQAVAVGEGGALGGGGVGDEGGELVAGPDLGHAGDRDDGEGHAT